MNNLEYANHVMRAYPDVSEDVKQSVRDSLSEWLYDEKPLDRDHLKKVILLDMENG